LEVAAYIPKIVMRVQQHSFQMAAGDKTVGSRPVWGTPQRRGLRVATLGFLIAAGGALTALLGGMLRDWTVNPTLHVFSILLLYLGWTLLISGTGVCFIGILLGWWFLFYREP